MTPLYHLYHEKVNEISEKGHGQGYTFHCNIFTVGTPAHERPDQNTHQQIERVWITRWNTRNYLLITRIICKWRSMIAKIAGCDRGSFVLVSRIMFVWMERFNSSGSNQSFIGSLSVSVHGLCTSLHPVLIILNSSSASVSYYYHRNLMINCITNSR